MGRHPDTEYHLANWRGTSTASERMAANILLLAGYKEIDPQQPLGGPDGGKDILCKKDDKTYSVGCYFPKIPRSWTQIKTKFQHDLQAAKSAKVSGIVFVTGQRLSGADKNRMAKFAATEGLEVVAFGLDRLLTYLDSPAGYGIRYEYLGLVMSKEEQIAFWKEHRDITNKVIESNTGSLNNLAQRLEKYIDERVSDLEATKYSATRLLLVLLMFGREMESSFSELSKLKSRISAFVENNHYFFKMNADRLRGYILRDKNISAELRELSIKNIEDFKKLSEAGVLIFGKKDDEQSLDYQDILETAARGMSGKAPKDREGVLREALKKVYEWHFVPKKAEIKIKVLMQFLEGDSLFDKRLDEMVSDLTEPQINELCKKYEKRLQEPNGA